MAVLTITVISVAITITAYFIGIEVGYDARNSRPMEERSTPRR